MPFGVRSPLVFLAACGLLLAALVVFSFTIVLPIWAFTLPNDVDGHLHVQGLVTDEERCGTYVRGAENSGYQTNPATYSYTTPSPLGFAGAANQIDRHWVHDTDSDFLVWDMGWPVTTIDLFPAIDHGPVPEEALEGTVYGSNSLAAPEATWAVADISVIFDGGWDAAWISDDYVSRWVLPAAFRYIGVHWGGPKAMISDGDIEVDAVCAPAQLSNCGPYLDQAAMVNDGRPSCRATYIYDAGQGNLVTRQDLLDNAAYFMSQGFDMNFLWYAPEQSVTFQSGDPTQWSYCPTVAQHLGQGCSLAPAFTNLRDVFSQDVKLQLHIL